MLFADFFTVEAAIHFSTFNGACSEEYNLMVMPQKGGTIAEQLQAIETGIKAFCRAHSVSLESMVFQRYFISDYANQSDVFNHLEDASGAVSIIQQSPLNGVKVGLWANMLKSTTAAPFIAEKRGHDLVLKHGKYAQIYTTQAHYKDAENDSFEETSQIFKDYLSILKHQQLTLEQHCIRTWFYVRDIDNNYDGLVKARNQVFELNQLTKDTHFIASTGIEGRYANPAVTVLMDAYAVGGIQPEQITFLQAQAHLNPTHEYGVAFERGTAVDYGDRRHIFISGTASIDSKGAIIHPGDVHKQTIRAIENIQALLLEADATINDISSMIIYLRDVSDYAGVAGYFMSHYAHIPYIIVHAPVCRPGWLIEIECIAIKQVENTQYECF